MLTVRAKSSDDRSLTETLPIIAKISFPKEISASSFSANKEIKGGDMLGRTETVGLTVTVFSSFDYIRHLFDLWNTPLNVFVVIIAAIIGAIGKDVLTKIWKRQRHPKATTGDQNHPANDNNPPVKNDTNALPRDLGKQSGDSDVSSNNK